jgi:glycosyltransferase involved in cell wall biosynthesis
LALRCAVVIHDAAVFDRPDAYRRPFVAWYRALFRWLAWRGVPIATVSQFSRARLSQCLKRSADAIAVIPNGAEHLDSLEPDESVLQRWGITSQRFILAVASANPLKNLHVLEHAYLMARLEGLQLVIAGGRMERVFAHTATAAHPRVIRIDHAQDAELVCLYRNAAFLAYPSTYEGFGIPPLEAMRLGCPVLATPCAALTEVLGPAAYFAASARAVDLEAAMKEMAANSSLRQRYSVLGLTRAAQFQWATAASQLRSFIAASFGS